MSILLDKSTRLIVQGIAGNVGRFSAVDMKNYGTTLVGGVASGKVDEAIAGVPIFQDVHSACRETGATASVIYVPAHRALDHVIEAFEAGIRLVVYPGDGLPMRDAIEMRAASKANGARLVGPNTPGIICPGKAKAGFMPSMCFTPGRLAVMSRSGSLSYEASFRMTQAGLGQSTVIGIGGDPIKGISVAEALELFDVDAETEAIVYLGEIGGHDEYVVADYAARRNAKPVAALVVGNQAPEGKKMGHAAALVGSKADTQPAKLNALAKAGAHTAAALNLLIDAVKAAAASATPGKTAAR